MRRQQRFRRLVQCDGPFGKQKMSASNEIKEGLGSLLQAWHGRQPLLSQGVRQLGRNGAAICYMRQQLFDRGFTMRSQTVGFAPSIG